MIRYIFVTGGVVSSLGKGIASASLGALLQARGYNVRIRKLDPYLNVDPGTMSPRQHGEVYVTEDGAETDLDLGHYERFTGVNARQSDNITTGQIYQTILKKERAGEYLGATIQVIPHVTDAIKAFILSDPGDDVDFVICEIGGTVGDIEGLPFFEAIRQLGQELGREQTIFLHLTLLPYIASAGEMKTKPTQHSVKELRSIGIQPDILLCRCDRPIPQTEKRKIASFCNVRPSSVIEARDVSHIYEVPRVYHEQGLDSEVLQHFSVSTPYPMDLRKWDTICANVNAPDGAVRIALVGKYTDVPDAYKSVMEALNHGGLANNVRVETVLVDSEALETNPAMLEALKLSHAILLPGGFGPRGAKGKMQAAQLAQANNIPCLGICYGMQLSVIALAQTLAGVTGAKSEEFVDEDGPILVGLMSRWQKGNDVETRSGNSDLGGTMRLGAYPADLRAGSLIANIYKSERISERHRHRYEVNADYIQTLEESGIVFSGLSPDGTLPEIFELANHPWFVGVQFHPELKSRPFAPHPLFASFIEAAMTHSRLI